jgi:hypothetical protein
VRVAGEIDCANAGVLRHALDAAIAGSPVWWNWTYRRCPSSTPPGAERWRMLMMWLQSGCGWWQPVM